MDNSYEFLNEILSFSNTALMPERDYLPFIIDYVYKNEKSKKSILLINKMKIDFLDKKKASKKLSTLERSNTYQEYKEILDSENYRQEIHISKKPNWKPMARDLRSVQSLGKSLREEG